MPGAPEVLVELDDGTGTYPYDISDYVDMRAGLDITRGRGDEFGEVSPSTLRLALDNSDGRFTLGAENYGVHVDQRIRVTLTAGGVTQQRFTGFVQEWPSTWTTPTASQATIQLSAVDQMARWSRNRVMSEVRAWTFLPTPPLAWYVLDEPEGSSAAGDFSGRGQPPARMVGAGNPVTFGEGATFVGGQSLLASLTQPILFERGDPGKTVFMGAFFTTTATGQTVGNKTATPEMTIMMLAAPGLGSLGALSITSTGKVALYTPDPSGGTKRWRASVVSSTTVNDGALHHAAAVFDPTGLLALYVDGEVEGISADGVTAPFPPSSTSLRIGYLFVGTVVLATVWDHGNVHVTEIHQAGGEGSPEETTDDRVARIAWLGGLDLTTLAL